MASNPTIVRPLVPEDRDRLLAEHPDLPRTVADCPTCRGKGVFLWYVPDTDDVAEWECNCENQFLLHRWFLASGIDKHYQRLRTEDAVAIPPVAEEVINDYIDHYENYVSSGLGLVLHGKPGTGKTLIAMLLLKALLKQGYDGYFTTFHVLLDRFTEGWGADEAKRWFDHRIRNAGLLIMDDIGREHQGRNAVAETALDHVLRARVSADRPTIITTNLSWDELKVVYSGNAVSLLSECSIVHRFDGEDFRPRLQARTIAEAKAGLTRPIVFD